MTKKHYKGRPRKITSKKVKDICRLGKQHPQATVARMLNIKSNTVNYYLKIHRITPIRTYKKREPKKKKIKVKLSKIISFLEKHFEKKLYLTSCSMFSKARIDRGICIYIIHKYSGERWDYICQELKLDWRNCTRDIKYAISKNVDNIVSELESKIKI
jgi:hypothetical protein